MEDSDKPAGRCIFWETTVDSDVINDERKTVHCAMLGYAPGCSKPGSKKSRAYMNRG